MKNYLAQTCLLLFFLIGTALGVQAQSTPTVQLSLIQAEPPALASVMDGIEVSATDSVTTGFDIYVDNVYTVSFTLDSSRTPVVFSPGGSWCEVRAASWAAGGLGHSSRSGIVTNTSNPACGTSQPITGGAAGICIDSIAYDQESFATLSQTTHCF